MDIVICATQRCGSTLFIEDMRNTEVLGQPQEYFIPWIREKRNVDWRKRLDALYNKARGANGVCSVKIMANQLAGIDKRLATFLSPQNDEIFSHFATTFQNAVWVWLRRDDILEQAISRVIARKTHVYHSTKNAGDGHFVGRIQKGYDKHYNLGIEYDSRQINREVNNIVLENLTWKYFFECHLFEPLIFTYEHIVADTEMRHLDMISKALGQQTRVAKLPRKIEKLGNELNREWRRRFLTDFVARRSR